MCLLNDLGALGLVQAYSLLRMGCCLRMEVVWIACMLLVSVLLPHKQANGMVIFLLYDDIYIYIQIYITRVRVFDLVLKAIT